MSHPGARLRALVAKEVVSIPGSFNALVARAVAAAGFEATYISGGATANVAGFPDVGLLTMTEVCRTIREVAERHDVPSGDHQRVPVEERTVVEECHRHLVGVDHLGPFDIDRDLTERARFGHAP